MMEIRAHGAAFFAAMNTAEGFKSYFREIFGGFENIYIIKGGPGTGKSSLMRRVAAAAEGRGYKVEYYFCSSDHTSLDGVLIFGKNSPVGIVDGTAPHVFEPTVAGVREELIDLGRFWNSGLLCEQKNEIISLTSKKSAAYHRAYSYLRSCGNLRAVTDSLLCKITDMQKLRAAAARLAASLELPQGRAVRLPALIRAVAMTGNVRLDSFEQNSKKLWRVGDFYGVGYWFLGALADCLKEVSATVRLSYDPVCPEHIDGIFVEDAACGFVISKPDCRAEDDHEDYEDEKFVNPKRFVHTEKLREIRGELRYAARLYQDCLDGALHALSEAKVYHFLLEDLYKHAMHFGALTEFTNELVPRILG